MSLRYEEPIHILQIKSKDDKILYHETSPLIERCKYIKDLYKQFDNKLSLIDLPFKAKAIDNFLIYFNDGIDLDANENGLTILKFARDVCLIADYLEFRRSMSSNILLLNFHRDVEIFLIESLSHHVSQNVISLIRKYKDMKSHPDTWRAIYETIDRVVKSMKRINHPYLSMNSRQAYEYFNIHIHGPIDAIQQKYELLFKERVKQDHPSLDANYNYPTYKINEMYPDLKSQKDDEIKCLTEKFEAFMHQ